MSFRLIGLNLGISKYQARSIYIKALKKLEVLLKGLE